MSLTPAILTLGTPRVWSKPGTPGPYRPPNGTEGRNFEDWFCAGCVHDHEAHMGKLEDGCTIFARSLALNLRDDGYPTEWVVAEDGFPACLAFDPDGCS